MPLPIALWTLEAIASLLGDRAAEKLRPGWRRRLAHKTAATDKHVEPRPLRRFLGKDETFVLLSSGSPDDYERLLDSLTESLRPRLRILRGRHEFETRRTTATRVLPILLKGFLAALDPSAAVAVASGRSTRQFEQLSAQQASILEAVGLPKDMEAQLAKQLPPNAREQLRLYSEAHGAETRRMLEALVQDERGVSEAVLALIDHPPEWLQAANYRAWLCLGEVAWGHSHGPAAARAFGGGVRSGAPNSSRWLARAGLAMLDDNVERADEFADRARHSGGDLLLGIYEAFRSKDMENVSRAAAGLIDANHPDIDLALAFKAASEMNQQHWDDCIDTCRERLRRSQDITSAHFFLARALLARIEQGRTPQAIQDWREAIHECMLCRDLRRLWAGPSHEAVALACRAALLSHDYGLCLRWGRQAPAGEATVHEALAEEVLSIVIAAATGSGRTDIAAELIGHLSDESEKAFHEGLLAEIRDDSTTARNKYLLAVSAARTDAHILKAVMGLAGTGEWPLPRLEEVRALDAEEAEQCVAMSEMVRGEYDAAIQRLRPLSSRGSLNLLGLVQSKAGQLDAAITTLHHEFTQYQDPEALVRVARLLLGEGLLDRAEAAVDDALGVVPGGTRQRLELQRLKIEIAGAGGRWADVVSHATAFLAEDEDRHDSTTTWSLLFGLNNLGRIPAAIDVLRNNPTLLPTSEDEARLWLPLTRELEPTSQLIVQVLDVGWSFADNEQIASMALMVAYEESRNLALDTATVARLHELTEAFLGTFPNSELFRRIDFTSIEDLIPQLRDELVSRAEVSTEAMRQVTDEGHPQGMLAAIAGRTYTECLIRRGAGLVPSVQAGAQEHALEATRATQTFDRPVVVDLSVLVTFAHQTKNWSHVVSAFESLVLHPAAVLDMQTARVELGQRSVGSLGWDPVADRPVLSEIDPTLADQLAEQADWIAQQLALFQVPGSHTLRPPKSAPGVSAERLGSWIGPIELAKDRGLPLLSDDVGQQRLAQGEGVESFSSMALFEALAAARRIHQEVRDSVRQTLLNNWGVDLEPSENEIVSLAVADQWGPGPGVMQFARPALWRDFQSTLAVFRRILPRVRETGRNQEMLWVGAALRGFGRAASTNEDWKMGAAQVLTYVLWLSRWSTPVMAALVEQLRFAQRELGRPDAFTMFVKHLYGQQIEELGRPLATSEMLRLISELDEDDKLEALRLVVTDA